MKAERVFALSLIFVSQCLLSRTVIAAATMPIRRPAALRVTTLTWKRRGHRDEARRRH